MRTERDVLTPWECRKIMISRISLLIGPPSDDPLGALGADALDLLEPLGLPLDDVEHLLAERPHQLFAVDGTDSSDHAGAEILLDPLDASWVAPRAGSSP